jgi:transcriptional regulator of arginine metabolism
MAATKKERELRREAVRHLLLDNKIGPLKDQQELIGLLKAMGIKATQASVSRDLREIGARWVEGHYEIPTWDESQVDPLELARPYLVAAKSAADNQILIITRRGAGGTVAEAVEARLGEDITGTVAGYSSVLVICLHKFFRDLVFDRLKDYFEPPEEEEAAPPPEAGEPQPSRDET